MQLKVTRGYHFLTYEINNICGNETSHFWEKYSGSVTFVQAFYNVSGFFKMLTFFDPLILCLGRYTEIIIRCEEKLYMVFPVLCQCMVH